MCIGEVTRDFDSVLFDKDLTPVTGIMRLNHADKIVSLKIQDRSLSDFFAQAIQPCMIKAGAGYTEKDGFYGKIEIDIDLGGANQKADNESESSKVENDSGKTETNSPDDKK